MNPIIKKSSDWIKSHKKIAISLACVTIAVIVTISTITIIDINNNNKLESNALAPSSSPESNLSSDSSSDESSSSSNESNINTNNSSSSSDREISSSYNTTSTGENTASSTPPTPPKQPTSNGGNNSTKPTPPTPTPTPPKPTPPALPTPPPVAQRTWEYMPSLSRQTFDLMNKFRQDNGVTPLTWNENYSNQAKKVAEDGASREVVYHEFSQIALGNGIGTAKSFIDQWASSPGHKDSMLETLDTNGAVAVYRDSNGRFYVVAHIDDPSWD